MEKNKADIFLKRHIGPSDSELSEILSTLNVSSLKELTDKILPTEINRKEAFQLPEPITESELLKQAKQKANKNKVFKSYIGMGYKSSFTPPVIQRHILENPCWYSSYTPYQSELAQGRLEALLNFQTMVADLTGMEISNASLLDEGTALAEALVLAKNANTKKATAKKLFVDYRIYPQSLEVLKTRCSAWAWEIEVGDFEKFKGGKEYFSAVIQYPFADGSIKNISDFTQLMKSDNCFTITATDLLSLCILKSPGEMGADVVVGSSQNFGIPLFYGGPHAAFLATKKEFIRLIPGRIVGVSKDRHGKQAYRLSLQTREQHIRREKATSNICTAQALLAVMASFYAIYHGPKNLKKMALKIHELTKKLYQILSSFKEIKILNSSFFDTISFSLPSQELTEKLYQAFQKERINLNQINKKSLSITFDEICEESDLLQIEQILKAILNSSKKTSQPPKLAIPQNCLRESSYLTHPVFNSYHSETELTRYIHRLQDKELSLTHSMIPLGSCTMKLNAVTELMPVSWPEFSSIHPFSPKDQSKGYHEIIEELEKQLCELTGFKAFSFQPNAGSQGEYAGLLAIKNYHSVHKEEHRNICLIPTSAHGTNPASAVMAGFQVVTLACTKEGLIDSKDLENKIKQYNKNLACLMMTYPSTYGFFEEVKEICNKIHKAGAFVYLDGANMNALLGLCKPAQLGFDVCHLNLHKSFCIPHGGGGPGVGPVGVNEKLKDFLPGHVFLDKQTKLGAVSSAPYGSAGILIISWAYIKLMGLEGLKKSAQVAMANANYIAEKLKDHYRILFKGQNNLVAHECIIDLRKFKNSANITVDDVAKRLIDYSFHSPTMSWPVPGTLMIEPTESESKEELDRFCSALISIREEIKEVEEKKNKGELIKSAPHNLEDAMMEKWSFPYSKQKAFYPLPWLKQRKFWPPVSRIENAYGDINPFCSCPPVS
ncbi:MAG: aminomethyl-transferring glycine dehydrogenase [Bdellovibrionaceae bacterium]|nr:aminomethyl-transferring glycine dehydrogenase [Pseudobdellovibrionaceae bacterium]